MLRLPPQMTGENNQDDASLLAAAQTDPRAFALLYDRYVDRVYRYCDRRLRDRDAAEDATSQVFERAFVNLHQCRPDAFRGWLFTIAHNMVVDSFRRQHPFASLESADLIPDESMSPEDVAISGEISASVRSLLHALSPDQREVIELRLAGLSGTESMQVLGIGRDVLGSRTFRAMSKLRTLLEAAEAKGGSR